jgi:hypothetical protein
MISFSNIFRMNGGKVGKCGRKKRKRSHLPCAGIILFRFYGYYLSLILPPMAGRTQHPGNFIEPVFRRQCKYM